MSYRNPSPKYPSHKRSPRLSTPVRLGVVVVAACFIASPVLANPVNPVVVNGAASFNQVGKVLTVTNSNGTIINWDKFSIKAGETTRFDQPSASSAVMNRVLNDPTAIYGTLSSNGRVWLINPSGIMVGPRGRIDTAAFVASTLNIRNEDFLAGRKLFVNDGTAKDIINQGEIRTPAGGSVYLIGSNVTNQGIITTPKGETILAAGAMVSLIDSATPGVKVEITGAEGNATNLGTITAEAGRIGIAGVIVRNSGRLNASSVVSEGGGIFLRASKDAYVDSAGRIVTTGTRGGRIDVLGGMSNGTAQIAGTLDASATGQGDGGFVETSAAQVHVAEGAHVTTAAPNGRSGTWLIDPVDFTIAATGGNMTGAALTTSLGGGNVSILSSNGTVGTAGDVNVNDVVAWSANKLTLNAYNNININANLNGSGSASLALEYGQGAVAAGNSSAYKIASGTQVNLPAGPRLSTKLGSDGAVRNYTVITSLGAQGSTTAADLQGMNGNLGGSYALGSDIDASATSSWNGGMGFAPVGGNFTGAFDGLNHTIAGLTINRSNDYVGLFGYVGAGSVIRNVGLEGGSVNGRWYVGGLIGNTYNATISNGYNTGSVSGDSYVGGLVGYNSSAISSSYSTGSVTGSGTMIGGLTGIKDGGTISNSYSTGSVGGGNYVGGLVGYAISGTISNSYSTGSVSGGTAGGLVGFSAGTTTSNSFWDTDTSGQVTSAGGTAKTTTQMKTAATFTGAGWSSTIWNLAGGAYPSLKNMPAPQVSACAGYDNCWTGAVSDLWSVTGNWSANHLPTASETVKVDVAGTPTISISGVNPSFGALWLAENLNVDAGVSFALSNLFTLNAGTATFNGTASVHGYSQTGGTLAGSGAFTVTHSFSQAGGNIDRTGAMNITQATGNLLFSAINVGPLNLQADSGSITASASGGISLAGASASDMVVVAAGRDLAVSGSVRSDKSISLASGATYDGTAFSASGYGGNIGLGTGSQLSAGDGVTYHGNNITVAALAGSAAPGSITQSAGGTVYGDTVSFYGSGNVTLNGSVTAVNYSPAALNIHAGTNYLNPATRTAYGGDILIGGSLDAQDVNIVANAGSSYGGGAISQSTASTITVRGGQMTATAYGDALFNGVMIAHDAPVTILAGHDSIGAVDVAGKNVSLGRIEAAGAYITATGAILDGNASATNIVAEWTGGPVIQLRSRGGGSAGGLAISADTATVGSITASVDSGASYGGISIRNNGATQPSQVILTDNATTNSSVAFTHTGSDLTPNSNYQFSAYGGTGSISIKAPENNLNYYNGPSFYGSRLTLDTGGTLSMNGSLHFAGDISLAAPTINVSGSGSVVSNSDLTINVINGGTLSNSGGVGASNNLTISAGRLSNTNWVWANNNLTISTGTLSNSNTVWASNNLTISATGTLSNSHSVGANSDLTINAGSISADGGDGFTAGHNIKATVQGNITLDHSAGIHASNDINLTLTGSGSTLSLSNGGYVYAEAISTINVDFTARGSGGVLINGVETTSTDAYTRTGFFAGPNPSPNPLNPAIEGVSLFFTYAQGSEVLDLCAFSPTLCNPPNPGVSPLVTEVNQAPRLDEEKAAKCADGSFGCEEEQITDGNKTDRRTHRGRVATCGI